MRRAERHGPWPFGPPKFWSRSRYPYDPLSWADEPAAAPGSVEPVDDAAACWESAWIDLGGEG